MSFRAAILLSADSKMALVVRSVFQHTELQGGVFMKPKVIKKALKDTIQAMTDCSWLFSARPGMLKARIHTKSLKLKAPAIRQFPSP